MVEIGFVFCHFSPANCCEFLLCVCEKERDGVHSTLAPHSIHFEFTWWFLRSVCSFLPAGIDRGNRMALPRVVVMCVDEFGWDICLHSNSCICQHLLVALLSCSWPIPVSLSLHSPFAPHHLLQFSNELKFTFSSKPFFSRSHSLTHTLFGTHHIATCFFFSSLLHLSFFSVCAALFTEF